MRTVSPDLLTLLQTRKFFMADLYMITLPSGTVLRYTSFDSDVAGYSSELGWERSTAKWSIGLQVDTMDVVLHARPDQLVDGKPIIESIASGDWDGAGISVSRGFMDVPGSLVGTILVFPGWIGDVTEVGRIHCKMQLQAKTALLNTGLPKALFGPGCRHVLFDSGCTLNRADFTMTGSVGAGSTTQVIQTGTSPTAIIAGPTAPPSLSDSSASGVLLPAPTTYYVTFTYVTATGETVPSPEASHTITSMSNLLHIASPPSVTGATGWNAYVGLEPGDEQLQNQTPIAIGTGFVMSAGGLYLSGASAPTSTSQGYYAQGVIMFTSGINAGRRRTIESNSGGTVTLRVPLPDPPLSGDTFTITPGCDHTIATCTQKFANAVHFGGFPYIPVPEAGSA